MDVGTALPTLSQIRNWDTEHLSQAADDWEAEARQMGNHLRAGTTSVLPRPIGKDKPVRQRWSAPGSTW